MAKTVDIADLRKTLSSGKRIVKNPFSVLKQIGLLVSDNLRPLEATEMVLRALEHGNAFAGYDSVLDSMVRSVGLFPYVNPNALSLPDLLAYEFHRPLDMPDDTVFHRVQAEVYRRLLGGENVILSAPTSFGKSRIIDALIAAERYRNVVVIVPTLALIDETRRRLAQFSEHYKIVTHLSQEPASRNVFVLTAERAVAYAELPKIDFFVIDEFYKIGAVEEPDESRVVALNQAFYRLRKHRAQFYLLGPNVDRIPDGLEETFRCSFIKTNCQTVVSELHRVPDTGTQEERLVSLARKLTEPSLVFCSSPARVNRTAKVFLENGVGVPSDQLRPAANWVARHYHKEWVFGRALLEGIGIHHGKLPRALSQYIVRMFNEEKLRFLICTSTLIEGVNTKAKNVVIYDNKIAQQKFDYFTFNNIKGRSGRMGEHFVGRVFLFNEQPQPKLPFVDFPLFTQAASAPASLLVQFDDNDLTNEAKARMKSIKQQTLLPVSVIRENSSIDPDKQIALARAIEADAGRMSRNLNWRQFPSKDQLKFACNLIWAHFVGSRKMRATVSSGDQLAFKIDRLRNKLTTAHQVREELKPSKWAAKGPNEAVERVLDFERTWATFEFPRYLMALSRTQASVLERFGLPVGDYGLFAAQVECLFRTPVVAALDEYGIPLQVAEKLQPLLGSKDNLDTALAKLRDLDLKRASLSPFEREVVIDAQNALQSGS